MPLNAQPLFVKGALSSSNPFATQNNITNVDSKLLNSFNSFKLLNAGWYLNTSNNNGFNYPQTKPT